MTRRNNTTATVWIHHAEEEFCPPVDHVLGVQVIGPGVALTIASYSETPSQCSYVTVAEVIVDLATLLKSIVTSTDPETALWVAQIPQAMVAPSSSTEDGAR